MAKISIPNLVSGVSTCYWIGDDLNKGTLVSMTAGSHGAPMHLGISSKGALTRRADCPSPHSVGTLTLYDSLFPWITRLICSTTFRSRYCDITKDPQYPCFCARIRGRKDVFALFTFEIAQYQKGYKCSPNSTLGRGRPSRSPCRTCRGGCSAGWGGGHPPGHPPQRPRSL